MICTLRLGLQRILVLNPSVVQCLNRLLSRHSNTSSKLPVWLSHFPWSSFTPGLQIFWEAGMQFSLCLMESVGHGNPVIDCLHEYHSGPQLWVDPHFNNALSLRRNPSLNHSWLVWGFRILKALFFININISCDRYPTLRRLLLDVLFLFILDSWFFFFLWRYMSRLFCFLLEAGKADNFQNQFTEWTCSTYAIDRRYSGGSMCDAKHDRGKKVILVF